MTYDSFRDPGLGGNTTTMKETTVTKKTVLVFVLLVILVYGYLAWLQSGCGELGGVMTWSGKVCVSDL